MRTFAKPHSSKSRSSQRLGFLRSARRKHWAAWLLLFAALLQVSEVFACAWHDAVVVHDTGAALAIDDAGSPSHLDESSDDHAKHCLHSAGAHASALAPSTIPTLPLARGHGFHSFALQRFWHSRQLQTPFRPPIKL